MREFDQGTVWEQIFSGIFIALWILSLPFVFAYRLLRWFITNVLKEAGNKVVQIVGGLIGLAIVGWIVQFFLHL